MIASATTDPESKTTVRQFRSARTRPEIALLLSTYQKPWHLRRVLTSIAVQEGVQHQMELVVTDDGSTDETPEIVRDFAESVRFPVSFTTHPHQAFQLARCRNEGARATSAPYLLFLDGDCVLPPDHVGRHLEHRRPGWAIGGFCCRFDEATTARFNDDVVRSGAYLRWAPRSELRALAKRARSALFYRLIRYATRPSLPGGNFAVWRTDYEKVNGFDENFQAWGGEDDDITRRLRRMGVRAASSNGWTRAYHLWHPIGPTVPRRVGDGQNIRYLDRPFRLARCVNGLAKRQPADVAVRVVGSPARPDAAAAILGSEWGRANRAAEPEIEVLFLPGEGRFSGRAECNVLVVLEPSPRAGRLVRKAHLLVSDHPHPHAPSEYRFKLSAMDEALRTLGHRQC